MPGESFHPRVRVRVRVRARVRVRYKCERSDRLNPLHMQAAIGCNRMNSYTA